MTACTTIEIHPSWYEHPLVAGAIARSKGDPVEVLKNIFRGLQWLDKHAQGKSFDDALADRAANGFHDSVDTFRQRLLAEGKTEAEVSAILDYEAPALGKLQQLPLKRRMEIRQRIAFLYGMGWPTKIIAAHMGMGVGSVSDQIRCSGHGTTLTERQVEIVKRATEIGNRAASKEFGVAQSSVTRWRQCYESQQAA